MHTHTHTRARARARIISNHTTLTILIGVGLQFSNYHLHPNMDYKLTMLHIIIIQLLAAVVNMFLAAYIDIIRPGKYGIGKHYLFPVKVLT